jgi:hypothetical protein
MRSDVRDGIENLLSAGMVRGLGPRRKLSSAARGFRAGDRTARLQHPKWLARMPRPKRCPKLGTDTAVRTNLGGVAEWFKASVLKTEEV